MFKIDYKTLQCEAEKKEAKQQSARVNQTVFDAIKITFVNLIDEITELKTYNAVQWIGCIGRWLRNIKSNNTTTYKRGDIVFLDLGAQNFGHEPSYKHACIVLANRYDSILIVPCSTKKYRKNHNGIIDATPIDGFKKNTGIQSEDFRWVSKNRVVSPVGNKVSSDVLNKLDEALLSFAPSIKKQIKQKDILIEKQKEQIILLKEQIRSKDKK